jgi:hypothetical protein
MVKKSQIQESANEEAESRDVSAAHVIILSSEQTGAAETEQS